MRLRAAVLLSLLAAAPIAHSQEVRTRGVMNGRFWRATVSMGRTEAMVYVQGFLDASVIQGSSTAKAFNKCRCSIDDLVDGVSAFYEWDPAYLRLPIGTAIEIAAWRAAGEPKEKLSAHADSVLRALAEP